MNNRGYTLVELLATIVILGLVMGIATYGVIGVINISKERSEKIFVDNLEAVINTYINEKRLNGDWITNNTGKVFDKCRRIKEEDGSCYSEEDKSEVELYEVKDSSGNDIKLNVLEDEKYIQGGKIINSRNNKVCLEGLSSEEIPKILLYKDSDTVYYYYIDLSGCIVGEENAIISNIPKNMCSVLGWNYNNNKVCVKR